MIATMNDSRRQAIAGLFPPQLGEALIRQAWPSVAAFPAIASLGRTLILSYVGAPLGWALMLPVYFAKILPFVARRYTITNKRVMIQTGLKPQPIAEVELTKIEDVRIQKDVNSEFFRSGNLELITDGKVALTLVGVPEPESFRICILSATRAWGFSKSVSPTGNNS